MVDVLYAVAYVLLTLNMRRLNILLANRAGLRFFDVGLFGGLGSRLMDRGSSET